MNNIFRPNFYTSFIYLLASWLPIFVAKSQKMSKWSMLFYFFDLELPCWPKVPNWSENLYELYFSPYLVSHKVSYRCIGCKWAICKNMLFLAYFHFSGGWRLLGKRYENFLRWNYWSNLWEHSYKVSCIFVKICAYGIKQKLAKIEKMMFSAFIAIRASPIAPKPSLIDSTSNFRSSQVHRTTQTSLG